MHGSYQHAHPDTWLARNVQLMPCRDHGLTDRDLEALSYESAPNPHYYGAPMKLYLEHEVSNTATSVKGSHLHVSGLQMYSRSTGGSTDTGWLMLDIVHVRAC